MNILGIITTLQKWAPVIQTLSGMFGDDPEKALEAVRSWELARRKETDKRLARLRDREDS